MKWKRSKKAQQEAKEKKGQQQQQQQQGTSSSSSSSSSSSVSSSSPSLTSSTPAALTSASSNANLVSIQSISGPISEHIVTNKTTDKLLDANLLLSNSNGFHQPKSTMTNLEQHHRHIVNLSEYNSNLSIEESMQAAAKLNRRPMIFADGNQEMFRPYVV